MSWAALLLTGLLLAALLQAAAWLWQRKTRDAGIVDVVWSLSMGLLALLYASLADGDATRRLLVGALAAIWSFRLAWFLLTKRVIGRHEDGRYRRLREHWGPRAQAMFLGFFQLQAVAAVLLSVPFLVVATTRDPLPAWAAIAAIAVWLVAVLGESIADRQLARWRDDPASKGRTCRAGLWRYSRHPNYFFEWLHWFTYPLLAIGSGYAWITWLGPVVMLATLLKGTGIPYTEQQALASRGDDYRDYQRTTSMFVPWFPRP
jgi:steroid 5-alpha reductase family enzyme